MGGGFSIRHSRLGLVAEEGEGRQGASHRTSVDVSVVIPMRNEEDNVVPLCRELREVIEREDMSYEVIIIDDGSNDNTRDRLETCLRGDCRFRVIEFTRSFGQSAALGAGFRLARGRFIVPIDGDRQNDPRDIARLVQKLLKDDTYDIISGWRKDRKDKWLSRRFPSLLANYIVRRLTWCNGIHDFGCTLKAYRREVLQDVNLYGEMHRFLPAICRWRGARLGELEVNHRPRVAGETKYGLKRTVKVLLDLITVKFLGDYLAKPLYFFGKLAMVCMLVSVLSLVMAGAQKLGHFTESGSPVMLNDSIFTLFGMLTVLVATMLVMMGVLSELLVRIYHESQGRTPYKIRGIMGMCEGDGRGGEWAGNNENRNRW